LGLKLVRAHTSHIITIDGVKKMGIEAIFFLNNDIIILKCKAHWRLFYFVANIFFQYTGP